MSAHARAHALIERVIPFRFLKNDLREDLVPRMEPHSFREQEQIIRQGDRGDRAVYLLESGRVSVVSPRELSEDGTPHHIMTIEPGHYFGEWESIFDLPRMYEVRARDDVTLFRLEGEDFLSLMNSSPAFAQGLGTLLRDRQGIFAAFERFKAELLREVTQGHIIVAKLLPLYRSLEPALHAGIGNNWRLDTAALSYSVRRLPENVTRTFALLLSDELSGAYGEPDAYFPSVTTRARRREVWEMLPGKDLVLIRNGLSDLYDLITCLCTYSIEAQKLRRRLNHSSHLKEISNFVVSRQQESASGCVEELSSIVEREREFLESLPLEQQEVEGLLQLWPGETVPRIFEILRHREMFAIDVRRRTNTYNSRRAELWTAQLAAATREHLGVDPSCLPDDTEVHIVSSNTHSVTNCLNPWYRENAERVFAWGARERAELSNEQWESGADLLYALARDYFEEHPDQAHESRDTEAAHGILRLQSTASTGIQVQIIDVPRLASHLLDEGIQADSGAKRKVIVNIDYAFGEQAEHIMRNLLLLYGRNVASINFLGKAGALAGKRGDVLRPTAFIEQSSDLFQPIPNAGHGWAERLEKRLGNRTLHHGPMLTVDGTLLQNRLMLHFYSRIWNCIGLEMEGTYYYRQVLESTQLKVIRPDVRYRFFYYVSDLPMAPHGSLSSRMALSEGVPPLYAITRHILDEIFEEH